MSLESSQQAGAEKFVPSFSQAQFMISFSRFKRKPGLPPTLSYRPSTSRFANPFACLPIDSEIHHRQGNRIFHKLRLVIALSE